MKRDGLSFLACLLLGWGGISAVRRPVVRPGDRHGGRCDDAIAQNAAVADTAVQSAGFKVFRTIHADVVAIDQPYVINRLGASQPEGMIFVLKSDLVAKDTSNDKKLDYDNFKLRDGKRPRPLVLRMNVGDLLEIHFENWLQSLKAKPNDLALKRPFEQKTRYAGIHVNGLELVPEKVGDRGGIKSDGSWVGTNDSGLLQPRATADKTKPAELSITYRLYARESGTFLMTSGADTTVHQLNAGLFGAVNVQPRGAEWYRSQTTRNEMLAATLTKNDLRALEPTSDLVQQSRKLDPQQATPVSDSPIARSLEPYTLKTTAPGGNAQVSANVYIDPQGRIYSKYGQPLINYFAVFKTDSNLDNPSASMNKPVLSMVKACPTPGSKSVPFDPDSEESFKREIERLDNGLISLNLREQFKKKANIDLVPEATVARSAYEKKYSWVVTNPGTVATKKGSPIVPGKTYLLQGEVKTYTFSIQECQLHLVHSDLTALITGPNAGTFPYSQDEPDFYTNPASPDRRQPYREFTIIYHQAGNAVQAFPQWSNNNLFGMINAGMDGFGINYGIAAIGPEIVANRLGVGPMGNSQQPESSSSTPTAPQANQTNDAVDLKYEEFFLSSWCVGDPAMIVDLPANAPNAMVDNPGNGSKISGQNEDNPVSFGNFKPLSGRATKAFYPDDPSNVYHSYMRDHTKMRVLHAGPGPAHVHHLHAHQWLKSPNSPEATYLDSQLILPGSAYTLEITYNGSGNRNQTVGDSIFHCHFYPHFAKGMWSLWRVHDTFEEGTELKREDGVCVTGKPNRALPDGEIEAGTPTPALIPMPSLGMAPMPAPVQLTDLSPWYDPGKGKGRRVSVIPKNWPKILNKFDANHNGTLEDNERDTWHKSIADAEKTNRDNKLKGYDLQLTPWDPSSNVPTSGPKSTVYAGMDSSNILHIRIFDSSGKIEMESDLKKLPSRSGEVFTTLAKLKPTLSTPRRADPGRKSRSARRVETDLRFESGVRRT